MRVPLSLLEQLVEIPVEVEDLAALMNGRIAEVEQILRFPSQEALADVRVIRLNQKLESDGTWGLWTAQSHEGETHIVVGEEHQVQAKGLYAAVIAGGKTPGGTTVEPRQVGPYESQGMLVSEAMIGIGEDATRPISVVEAQPGAAIHEVLDLDDVILEFDLEPNRPDLFSLIGMARDLSAIFNVPMSAPPALSPSEWEMLPPDELSVNIQATDKVHRYAGLEVTGVAVGPSPQWLQNAVRKLGMRPINNVVDSANLAMLELGQPMHTFDRACLNTREIGLRMAHPDETITTLDGEERTLTDECLLVTDGDTPIALAGVMGDATSGITTTTTNLLIESACFDMAVVRRCSRRLSLRTESSLRFEKGLPASQVLPATARLAWLLAEHGGAQVKVGRLVDSYPNKSEPKTIRFSTQVARDRLGMEVDDETIRRRFEHLGFQVAEDWTVTVPDFRPDVSIQADLNEEVGRIHGYEHVVAEAPSAPLEVPRANSVYTKGFALRQALAGAGFDEVYLGLWVGEEEVADYGLDPESLLELKNPLASNLRWFRPTTLPDILKALQLNRKNHERVALFEIGKIYLRTPEGINERHHLSGGLAAAGKDPNGQRFYEVRDALVGALDTLGIQVQTSRTPSADWMQPDCFHPGRSMALEVRGNQVGFVGEIHPRLVAKADFNEPPVTFHLDLQALLEERPPIRQFAPPPRFPSVEYHLNVLTPENTWVEDVLNLVQEANLEHFQTGGLRSVYSGDGVPSGHKRLTLELVFNHPDRSLTHEEAGDQLQRLKPLLQKNGLTVEL